MITIFSPLWHRRMVVGMVALILFPTITMADTSPSPEKTKAASEESGSEETPQPKFIWGILIKFAASKAFEIFSEWTIKNIFKNMASPLMFARDAAVSEPGAAVLAPAQKSAEPITPNITDSAPTTPLVAESGRENYQGAHLALLVLQPDGQTFKVRPISEGFKSGEKFRLRIGTTFDGELSLDNINPQGKRDRLYPANVGQVVKIRNSTPVIMPLDKDSYFEFDDIAGEEKLVITLRDPRAQGDATAQTPVYRQENAHGTGLLQEVAAGKYAAIAESITLQHRQ